MTCPACIIRNPPPLTPNEAKHYIATKGNNNQYIQSPWVYFYDDQEQEIHGDDAEASHSVLAAVCVCATLEYDHRGENTWELYLSETNRG